MPYVVESLYDGDETWEAQPTHVYSEVSEAAEAADTQNRVYNNPRIYGTRPPYTFRVREITMEDPLAWRLWVRGEIAEGRLPPVPWESGYLLEHLDPNKPTMVRFIRDDKDALRFRFTSMAVGRFLTRFKDFDQEQIEKYCAMVGLDMQVSKLHISKSADEFERVYLNGPHSCMAYEAIHGRYGEEDSHPVRLYADLDLAVAYITRGEDIVARTLVWPEKKIHGRVYGDANRIKLRLEEEGYTENWDFTGARLHFQRNKYEDIRAPYVDGGLNGIRSPCGDYIILSKYDGNIILESDSGTAYTENCGECGTTEQRLDWSDRFDSYVCSPCEEREHCDD